MRRRPIKRASRAGRAIDAVLNDRPVPSDRLEPEDVEALRAAIELRAAVAGDDQPDPAFVAGLRRRMAGEEPANRAIDRRTLLAGAAAVAAGVAGFGLDRALQSGGDNARTPTGVAAPVTGRNTIDPVEGVWVPVATEADVTAGVTTRFATSTAVGFVTDAGGSLSAVSGACTHQGCLLRLNQQAGRLDCPCHRTAFSTQGDLLFSRLQAAPAPLPKMHVRRNGGHIEVLIPPPA
jgi:cytochrome b6-f complex iron-sulfur subunit